VYQPAHGHFQVADPAAELHALAARVPASLVTFGADGFRVTVLPMLYTRIGTGGVLHGHVARPNPQWRDIEEGAVAVAIFSGPDAYVSPAWYAEKRRTGKVVPTWNYATVVAHGSVRAIHDPDWLLDHVRWLVDRHEAGRPEPWSVDDAPDGYVETQARAIVGLELQIDRIDAKRKLSQNRAADDVEGVIAALSDGTPRDRAVADDMRGERRRAARPTS
jgi:transcriptional regulator